MGRGDEVPLAVGRRRRFSSSSSSSTSEDDGSAASGGRLPRISPTEALRTSQVAMNYAPKPGRKDKSRKNVRFELPPIDERPGSTKKKKTKMSDESPVTPSIQQHQKHPQDLLTLSQQSAANKSILKRRPSEDGPAVRVDQLYEVPVLTQQERALCCPHQLAGKVPVKTSCHMCQTEGDKLRAETERAKFQMHRSVSRERMTIAKLVKLQSFDADADFEDIANSVAKNPLMLKSGRHWPLKERNSSFNDVTMDNGGADSHDASAHPVVGPLPSGPPRRHQKKVRFDLPQDLSGADVAHEACWGLFRGASMDELRVRPPTPPPPPRTPSPTFNPLTLQVLSAQVVLTVYYKLQYEVKELEVVRAITAVKGFNLQEHAQSVPDCPLLRELQRRETLNRKSKGDAFLPPTAHDQGEDVRLDSASAVSSPGNLEWISSTVPKDRGHLLPPLKSAILLRSDSESRTSSPADDYLTSTGRRVREQRAAIKRAGFKPRALSLDETAHRMRLKAILPKDDYLDFLAGEQEKVLAGNGAD